MEYLFIYGLQIADLIHYLAVGCIIFLCVSVFIALVLIGLYVCDDYEFQKWKQKVLPIFKRMWLGFSVASLILFLFPTKQSLLLMGGTYYGKKAINAVAASGKLQKVNTIIDLQLDKYIKELNKQESMP